MLLNSLPSGGTITRAACGRTMRRIASPYLIPSDFAASIWPLSIESIPARMISRMYAPSLMLSARIPATASAGTSEADVDAGHAEGEVDEEDLHEHRGAAEDQDVDRRERAERPDPRHPRQRGSEAEQDPRRLGDDRDVDRRPERVGERGVRMEDPRPDDVPVDCDEHVHPATSSARTR